MQLANRNSLVCFNAPFPPVVSLPSLPVRHQFLLLRLLVLFRGLWLMDDGSGRKVGRRTEFFASNRSASASSTFRLSTLPTSSLASWVLSKSSSNRTTAR